MTELPVVGQAFGKALRDLTRRDILWQAIWPALASFIGWVVIATMVWKPVSAWLINYIPHWSWLDWLGPYLVHFVLLLALAPLVYFTVLALVAVFALPRMMTIVAQRDFPDLARLGSPSAAMWGSVMNTLKAGAIFVIGWLLCIPLLLVPGALLILPLLWGAWLNQKTFSFDVLAEHASEAERNDLLVRGKGQFWLAGLASTLAAHVPLVNVLAPAFGALMFVHVGLGSLKKLRLKELR